MDFDLSPNELAALEGQRNSLHLDPIQVHRIHVNAVQHISNAVLADGIVTAEELQALIRIGTALGVKWEDLPSDQVHTFHIAHTCMEIQRGVLPSLSSSASSLRELPDEVVHVEMPVQVLDDKVIARHYVGASSGMSIRIAKGVSYRFGATRGHSVPVTAVVAVDQGTLSISNKRVAFIGLKKSFSVEWTKVLSAEPLSDGVHFAFQSRSKSALLRYADPGRAEIISAILFHYINL